MFWCSRRNLNEDDRSSWTNCWIASSATTAVNGGGCDYYSGCLCDGQCSAFNGSNAERSESKSHATTYRACPNYVPNPATTTATISNISLSDWILSIRSAASKPDRTSRSLGQLVMSIATPTPRLSGIPKLFFHLPDHSE